MADNNLAQKQKHGKREIGLQVDHADNEDHQDPNAEPPGESPKDVHMMSQLMEIIEYEETIVKLRNEKNFKSAYTRALNQSKYDAEIQNISNLVFMYELSIKAVGADFMSDIPDKILLIIRNKTRLTARQVENVSNDLRVQKRYLKSILFYPIAFYLFEENHDPDRDVKSMQCCVCGMKKSAELMLRKDQNMKRVVRHHMIPLMHELKSKIKNLPGVDAELKVVQLSECLNHIVFCEWLVDIDTFHTNTEGLKLMGTLKNKYDYSVNGNLLHNNAMWCDSKGRYEEAAIKFKEAIESFNRTINWADNEEKQKKIKKSENGFKISEEKFLEKKKLDSNISSETTN